MQNMSNDNWQGSKPHDSNLYMLKSGHLSDINICVGSEVFKCHKLILTAGSSVFEKMFYGNFKENNEKDITITDIEPEDFQVFLEYIYTGQDITNLEIYSIESLKSFIYIGKKYFRPEFAKFGYTGLEKVPLSVHRFVDLIELFDFAKKIDYDILINSLSQEFKRRTFKANLFNNALSNLSIKIFNDLIKCINGDAIRFHWIEEYVRQNKLHEKQEVKLDKKTTTEKEISNNECEPEKKKKKAEDWKILLKSVDFNNMTTEEIMKGPAKSNLLSSDDKFKILINKCKAQEKEKKTCKYCGRQ